MKKKFITLSVIATCLSLASCSGGGKESAASIASKWCELNGKAHKAEGADKDAAKAEVDKYENEIEAKYKSDDVFMKEIEKEVNKCEDASEGR